MKSSAFVAGVGAAGIMLALSQAGWSGTTAGAAAPLVAVIAARTGDTPIRFNARGHLVAINQVALRPRREAVVSEVHFREGDTVRAGQLLFTLDERAAPDRPARTRITAPIAGTAGALTVHAGSLVLPGAATPLVSLIQLDPIMVVFTLPAQGLAGILAARAGATLEVVLELPGGATVEGKLESIDQSAAADGGAVGLKAVFPNPKRELWPASFANVRLVAGRMRGTAVLPAQALHHGVGGPFVLLVDANDRVSAQAVSLLRTEDEGAVVAGLKDGQLVVLDAGLRAGAKVRVAQ